MAEAGPMQACQNIYARYFFERLQASGSRIGILRTRLGIDGYEMRGPEEAARAILEYFFS